MTNRTPVPLTMSQAALWFGQTLDPENPTFNVCDAVEFSGEIDLELLTRATHLAVTESDALTTRFVETGDGIRQLPGDAVLDPPPVLATGTGNLWDRAHEVISAWTARPHDLTAEPGVAHWILHGGDRTLWILAAHHALIDAYGLSLVFTRGAEIYRGLAAGDDAAGRRLGSLHEVITADLDYLDSPTCADDAAFWAGRLDGSSDRPADAAQARTVRSIRTTIAPLAGGNWAATVVAAAAAFGTRRTGIHHQSLGFLLMNRLGLAAARVPTTAVNLVPLAVPTRPADQVAAVIEATATAMRTVSAHQRHRGALIGDDPTLTAGLARHAGTVVNVKPFATVLDFAGIRGVVHSIDRGPVQDYALTVAIGPDGRPEVILDADAARYDAAEATALLDAFAAFLQDFAAPEAAGRPLASLPLTTAAQRAHVLALGDGGTNPEGTTPVLDRFDATVAAQPEALAVVAHDATLTFAALAERSRRVAVALRAAGVEAEDRVAVVAESSATALAAILGVWRAGAAYVPVDPSYPAARIAHQLTDSRPAAVLVGAPDRGLVEGLTGATILDLAGHPASSGESAGRRSHPDAVAYVIYTSGSTGTPKGVVITQRAIATLLGAHRNFTMRAPRQRLLATHTLSFDSSVSNIAWLCDGHTLHVIERADVTSADLVVDYVRRHRIDYVDAVPVLIEEYVRAGLIEPAARRHVPGTLSTGGEAFPSGLWERLTDRPDVTVFNLYGPTEATVEITYTEVTDTPVPSIGVPALGARLYVLDAHLQLVAEGATGELYVGTPQLARGYHDRPALTAERFVASPFGDGTRLYRTGDLVRWNAFGGLDYLGRADDQVQLAGFRIEFGEVEALVEAAARQTGIGVERVVADVRPAPSGTRRLVAYLVGTDGDDFAGLRAALAATAPAHLVPAVFVPAATLPRAPSGKTDRAALPDPWAGRTGAIVAPGDGAEAILAKIVADLLDLDEVDPDDDFFTLGGDSIIAIGVTSRARAAGLTVTPRQVFELRTPRALAAAATDSAGPAGAADPVHAAGRAPLTPLMRRVLRHGGIGGFAQARVLRVPAGLGTGLLDEALTAVVHAHPVLAAALDGDALVVPGPEATPAVALTEHDLSGTVDLEARVEALAAAAARDLDPAGPGLLRALLLRGLPGEDDWDALVLVVHHLAVDGVSWRILTEDLRAVTGQLSRARAAAPDPEGTSWREWALALTARAQEPDILDSSPRWAHPGGAPSEIGLGTRPLDPAVDTATGMRRREIEFPADAAVGRLPQLYNTGPTEILLGTLAVAIGTVAAVPGSRRLFVDVEGHGRDEALVPGTDLSRTVGWFTALRPIPVDLPSGTGPAEIDAAEVDAVIKQVKETLAAPRFSGLEYGLLTELGPAATARPASPVLFNYLGRLTTGEGDAPFSSLWPQRPLLVLHDDAMPASHPLEVNAVTVPAVSGSVVRAEFSWAAGVVDDAHIDEIARAWTALLTLLDDPELHPALGGATPSDSLVDDLTQDEIDEFSALFA
ncbi:amino acid adenylation domain-containing protein [Gordonia sp. (in: high G+C Gram-positive bacteria)]|uniref:amino acid adenylation domain-containing protein n=1 Tax=Gordonia sp. (in: high G+C Gram-positive bacteria) TaxID=84139 RepID=UPI0035292703